MIYKLKATLDRGKEKENKEKEVVFRDIKIKSTHTLMDLHKALKKSFGFSQEELSSFYYVDENWKVTKEISLENMTQEEDFTTMVDISIGEAFPQKSTKLLYVYDFLNFWTFHLEVMEIENKQGVFSSPLTINTQGKMPIKAPDRNFEDSSKSNSSNKKKDYLEDEGQLEEYFESSSFEGEDFEDISFDEDQKDDKEDYKENDEDENEFEK